MCEVSIPYMSSPWWIVCRISEKIAGWSAMPLEIYLAPKSWGEWELNNDRQDVGQRSNYGGHEVTIQLGDTNTKTVRVCPR